MTPRPTRTVLLVGSPGVLGEVDDRLSRRGVRVRRVPTLRIRRLPRERLWKAIDRFGTFDTAVFTSGEAVRSLLPVRSRGPGDPRLRSAEVLAIGPATAHELRAAGVRPTWVSASPDSRALVDRLRRARSLRIVYPRSTEAGPRLARELVREGHRVLDLVAYRVEAPERLPPGSLAALRDADLVVVTSPSALHHLRRLVGPGPFEGLRRAQKLVVLGGRSARAARGHGFRGVRVAGTASAQGFTHFLLGELGHAP